MVIERAEANDTRQKLCGLELSLETVGQSHGPTSLLLTKSKQWPFAGVFGHLQSDPGEDFSAGLK
jgi:hypothetical protein